MRLICLVFSVLFVYVDGGNVLKDVISPKGWDLGYGVVLKVNESHKGKNLPISERLSVDLSLGDLVGVSVGKAKSDGVEFDFYINKDAAVEGRGKKDDEKYIIPLLIGYKTVILVSAAFLTMKVLTLKAIFLAKAALLISVFVMLSKLKHKHHPTEIVEVEHHAPHVSTYHDQGYHGYGGLETSFSGHGGYGREAQPSNLYQDVVYAPGSGPEAGPVFAGIAPVESDIALARKGQEVERRRDNGYFGPQRRTVTAGSKLSVKKFTSADS